MILSTLVKPEIEYLIENCNFTDDEIAVFKRRCKGQTLTRIAYELNMSGDTAARLSQRINKKIQKVGLKDYNKM